MPAGRWVIQFASHRLKCLPQAPGVSAVFWIRICWAAGCRSEEKNAWGIRSWVHWADSWAWPWQSLLSGKNSHLPPTASSSRTELRTSPKAGLSETKSQQASSGPRVRVTSVPLGQIRLQTPETLPSSGEIFCTVPDSRSRRVKCFGAEEVLAIM